MTDKKTERHIWVGRLYIFFNFKSMIGIMSLLILMTQIHCVPSKHLTSIIIS